MIRINLQLLIIIWWIGAAIAASAFLIRIYKIYLIVGIAGWIIISTSTMLIIYEIRRIKEEDKSKELAEK
jgi:membrane protein implicated in regulation of membrane protease activity